MPWGPDGGRGPLLRPPPPPLLLLLLLLATAAARGAEAHGGGAGGGLGGGEGWPMLNPHWAPSLKGWVHIAVELLVLYRLWNWFFWGAPLLV